MTASSETTKNLKDPTFYRNEEPQKEMDRPVDRVDYRDQNGPLLSYIHTESLHGQELYLGAEIGCDGKVRQVKSSRSA